MRDRLNCPNCGAPITAEKCAFCGTLFYDFSAIEIGKPCYLKIKHENNIFLVKAMATNAELNMNTETCDAYDVMGNHIISCVSKRDMNLSIEFRCVPFKNHLLEVRSVQI